MIASAKHIEPSRRHHVVLIHGLAASRPLMWPLAWQIGRHGFSTSNFGYPSCWWSIEHHARKLASHLTKLDSNPEIESVYVVAHSMGGIVTSQAVLNSKLEKLQRIVMLGSPNRGSPVAKALGVVLPFCKTLQQLSDRPDSYVMGLDEPEGVEVGIVAAQHDRVIPEPSSHLKCEADHISVFSGHNGLLVRPTAIRFVTNFLKYGKFLTSR